MLPSFAIPMVTTLRLYFGKHARKPLLTIGHCSLETVRPRKNSIVEPARAYPDFSIFYEEVTIERQTVTSILKVLFNISDYRIRSRRTFNCLEF
jgi:hypothetical protein